MPCRSGLEEAEEKEYVKEADEVTAMLCELCKGLDNFNYSQGLSMHGHPFYVPKKIQDWWEEHKKLDEKRNFNKP